MRAVVLFVFALIAVYALLKLSSLREYATDQWAVVVLQNGRAVRAEHIGVCWRLPFIEQFDLVAMDPTPLTLRDIRGATRDALRVDIDVEVTIARVDALKVYRRQRTLTAEANHLIRGVARSTLSACGHLALVRMPDVVADEILIGCQHALAPLGLAMAHVSIAGVRSTSAAFATLDALAAAANRHAEMLLDAASHAAVGRVRARGRRDELGILDPSVRASDPATVDLVRTNLMFESGAVAVVVQPATGAPMPPPRSDPTTNGHRWALVVDPAPS